MNRYYQDIITRIAEPPKWFDEYSVPRYCEFEPREAANIYASECTLVLIQCQCCGMSFKVCFSSSKWEDNLEQRIVNKSLAYGDPPNIECCASGPTMTSDTIKVLEYWFKDRNLGRWVRKTSLEIEIIRSI